MACPGDRPLSSALGVSQRVLSASPGCDPISGGAPGHLPSEAGPGWWMADPEDVQRGRGPSSGMSFQMRSKKQLHFIFIRGGGFLS